MILFLLWKQFYHHSPRRWQCGRNDRLRLALFSRSHYDTEKLSYNINDCRQTSILDIENVEAVGSIASLVQLDSSRLHKLFSRC